MTGCNKKGTAANESEQKLQRTREERWELDQDAHTNTSRVGKRDRGRKGDRKRERERERERER